MSDRKSIISRIRAYSLSIFSRTFLKIRTKSKGIKPLVFNRAQHHIHKECEDQLQRIGKVRKILLKGRQQGGSTYCGARFYKKVTELIGFAAFILSHESKTTGKLYEMVQRYHDKCPEVIKPVKGKDSGKGGMTFPVIDGSYELGTARNAETGRGFTAQLFHGSEVAFWPFAEEILAGVMQAVPNEDGSEIILESTANGVGGTFYEYVMNALQGKGEFEIIFVPWYWQEEYQDKVVSTFIRTDSELELVDAVEKHCDGAKYNHSLTDTQLQWRRKKVVELGIDKFHQEYPSNIEEAFLFSGRPVFDMNGMIATLRLCREPVAWYRVAFGTKELIKLTDLEVEKLKRDDKGVTFEAAANLIQVFAEPVDTQQYSISADVAEGLENGDYSSIDALDTLGAQVLHYHGHLDTDLFGQLINIIGHHYCKAFVGVERNNHGHAVLQRLKDLLYPNLYFQEELDKDGEKENGKVGWLTTSASKPFIIDNLASLIRQESSGILCRHTIEQCFTYVIDEKGKTNARSGCYDDNVMSFAICHEMLRRMPRRKVKKPRSKNKRNWRVR
jgi:hypothetical protein